MTVWNAIVLGLIQGLTEFLPVSSSGHMSIIDNLFGIALVENGHLFLDVLLHFGTVLALFIVYWGDIVEMIHEFLGFISLGPQGGQRRHRYPAARQFFMLMLATLPLLLVLPVKKQIDSLYDSQYFIGAAIILTGCMLYVSDKMIAGKKTVGGMSVFDALIIGLCQCAAAIPGLSRTGVTVSAGIATGLKRSYAVKFAFLLAIPASLGSNILNMISAFRAGVDMANVPAYLIGMLAAMLSGIAGISLLRYIMDRGRFGALSYYCWVVGVLSIILTMIF